MRSVHIDKACQYLRIVFRENHPNKFNIFNQVALIQLRCKGSTLSSEQITKSTPSLQISSPKEIQMEKSVPHSISSFSRKLSQKKIKSVHLEQIQQKIVTLRSGMQQAEEPSKVEQKVRRLEEAKFEVQKLEFQKAKQLENQEYQKAKLIKLQIEKLKQEALLGSVENDQDPSSQFSTLGVLKGALITLDPIKNEKFVQESEFIQIGQKVKQERQNIIIVKSQEKKEDPVMPSSDQMIPSAVGKDKIIDYNTVGEDDFPLQSKDPQEQEKLELEPIQRQILGPLLDLFQNQAETISKLFSKYWTQRQKSFRFLQSKLEEAKREDSGLQALLVALNLGLKDKNSQIISKTLDIYGDILLQFKVQMSKKSIKCDAAPFESINLILFEKLGDSNSKVRNKALLTTVMLVIDSAFPPASVFQFFYKRQSYLKPGSYENSSHILGRLEVINTVLSESSVASLGIPVSSTLDFIINHCLRFSSQKKVRDQAVQAILALYEQIGFKRMEDYLTEKTLPDQLKDMLRCKMPELDAILPEKKKYEGMFKTRNGEEEIAAHDPSVRVIKKSKGKSEAQEEKK